MMRTRKLSVKKIALLLLFFVTPWGCGSSPQGEWTQQSGVDLTSDAIYQELNGIERNLHREIRQTDGSKRVTIPLEQLLPKYHRARGNSDCPIYFGQASVQPKFGVTGRFPSTPLKDIAAKLTAGEIKPDEITIQFMWINGKRVTINNRSLTVLYMAGMGPIKLIDRTDNPAARSPETLVEILWRLEGMAGKPSTEMLVRTSGLGRDGRIKEAADWDAPIGEIVNMPNDLLRLARSCERRDAAPRRAETEFKSCTSCSAGANDSSTARVMIHDENTVGFYIAPDRHGRTHRDKAFLRGEQIKGALVWDDLEAAGRLG